MDNSEQKAKEWLIDNIGDEATLKQLSTLTSIIMEQCRQVKGDIYSIITRAETHDIDDLGKLIMKQPTCDACLKIEIN